jgi:hypothetical protein
MSEDFKCPLVQAQEERVEAVPVPEPVEDNAELVLFGKSFKGFRTYSIILLIMIVFSYLVIKNGDVTNMKDLALMACGFLFGAKVASR